jgi:hypothetical protein
MDLPADASTRTAGPHAQPAGREAGRSRRRRPSGEPPPLPHHLQTSGVGWLVAAVVLMVLAVVVFAGGLRGSPSTWPCSTPPWWAGWAGSTCPGSGG